MKSLLLLIFIFSVPSLIFAQVEPQTPSVSLAYLGHFGYQPGLKIGLAHPISQWQSADEKKAFQLLLNPQIGFYTRPRFNNNIIGQLDLSLKRQKAERKSYGAFALGLGYVAQYEIISVSPNFNGEILEKVRERRSYLVPLVSYEFGRNINSNMSAYTKVSYGSRLSTRQESIALVYIELGLQFLLK